MKTDYFLVTLCVEKQTKRGAPYLDLRVRNLSREEIPAKVWSNNIGDSIEKSQILECQYSEGEYNGQLQIEIVSYKEVTCIEKREFLPSSGLDSEAIYVKFFEHVWENEDLSLFFGTLRTAFPAGLKEKLFAIPAGESNHHARLGGLLQHINELWDMAIHVSRLPHFEHLIDVELLQAAAVLHDLGKIHEYSPETLQFDQSHTGQSLGHLAFGALLVEQMWPVKGSTKYKERLQHILLAHHGSAGPILPASPEAVVFSCLDTLSAHLDVLRTAKQLQEQNSDWRLSWQPRRTSLKTMPLID